MRNVPQNAVAMMMILPKYENATTSPNPTVVIVITTHQIDEK